MSVSERRRKEKEIRRKAIIKAAKKVFAKTGFFNATMDNIAIESQLSKGTLYLYFKNKDDLYASILCDGMKLVGKILENIDTINNRFEDILVAYGIAYYEFSEEYPDLFKIMLDIHTGEFIKLENVADETMTEIKNYEEKIFSKHMKVLQKGIENGYINNDVNSCYATTMLWSIITGAVMLSKNHSRSKFLSNISPKIFIGDIIKMFLMAHSSSHELIERFRNEIRESASMQIPIDHKFKCPDNKNK